MKSNLEKRVEKARQLRFTPLKVKGAPEEFNTWGSKDDHYVVSLSSSHIKIYNDKERIITAFFATCNKHTVDIDNPYIVDIQCCKGNDRHTVCYHAIGKVIHAYKNTDKEIEFFEDYNVACDYEKSRFKGKLVKIFNSDEKGCIRGHIWAVVRDATGKKVELVGPMQVFPTDNVAQLLPAKENINLMRGPESDEGID
jgi:hypothetical protein